MSTSPERPTNAPGQWNSQLPDARKALMTILKHTAGLVALVAILVALGMNYELVWDLLAEMVPLALEVLEDALDTFFEKVVRLNPAFAQMATAYFGFVMAIVLLYFIVRKSMAWWKRGDQAYTSWKNTYVGAWSDWTLVQKTKLSAWWNTLDFGNKVITVVIAVLLGIPIALVLSIALGTAVASFL